jgi:hypothetical protein
MWMLSYINLASCTWAGSEEEKKADMETYGGDDKEEKDVTASVTARNNSWLSTTESAHRKSMSTSTTGKRVTFDS